ncbi:MAG: hypothetical protein ACFFDV_09170 [Candidatus Thorarchaeota archaeon]
MEEITIRYWSPHGRQEETKFHIGHSKIDLVMRAAKKIDLSNISKCSKLQTLDLSHNMLDELNLTALASCTSLNVLRIQSNHLASLDLWPLIDCIGLRELDLSENRLHSIDLSPIFLKTRVRLDSSVAVYADSLLRYIFVRDELVQRFHLVRPDGAPWTAPPVIMWSRYADLASKIGWAEVKRRIDSLLRDVTSEQWYSAQRGLLNGLDMAELAGYDGNPKMLLEGTDESDSFKDASHIIFDNAVQLLDAQLDNDGPTLFLDIQKMRKTSASKLIPKIVERRKDEIETTFIPSLGSKVFLESLWMTHYGFQILKAANVAIVTNLESFRSIKDSFAEVGLAIKTHETSMPQLADSGSISNGMRSHVLAIIQGSYD